MRSGSSTHIGSIGDAAREYAASWEIDSGWLDRVRNAARCRSARTLLEFTLPLSLFWLMLFWPMWLPMHLSGVRAALDR